MSPIVGWAARKGENSPVLQNTRKAGRNLFMLLAMLQCGNNGRPPVALTVQHGPTGGIGRRREKLAPLMLLGFNLKKIC